MLTPAQTRHTLAHLRGEPVPRRKLNAAVAAGILAADLTLTPIGEAWLDRKHALPGKPAFLSARLSAELYELRLRLTPAQIRAAAEALDVDPVAEIHGGPHHLRLRVSADLFDRIPAGAHANHLRRAILEAARG